MLGAYYLLKWIHVLLAITAVGANIVLVLITTWREQA